MSPKARFDKSRLPSRHVTEGMEAAASRSFMYGLGLDDAGLRQPIVGVAAAWNGAAPGGDAPQSIAAALERGVWAGGGTPRKFAVIADGAVHRGGVVAPSLLTRELVADSIELTMRGHSYDALAVVADSETALAGAMMTACRLDVPAVVFPALSPGSRPRAADRAMARVAETLGLAPAGAAEAEGDEAVAHACGVDLMDRMATDRRPRGLVDEEALLRAAAALGFEGAEAELLVHLVALAGECGCAVGMAGLCEAMAAAPDASVGRPGPPIWMGGTLAPEGALGIPAGGAAALELPARVFDGEAAAVDGLEADPMAAGTALVVRGVGPAGGPGMPGLESLRAVLERGAPLDDCVLISDGRAPAVEWLPRVSIVAPEAILEGPLARLGDGDLVSCDFGAGSIDAAPAAGGRDFEPVAPGRAGAAAAKYARLVGPARHGATTQGGAAVERVRYADV